MVAGMSPELRRALAKTRGALAYDEASETLRYNPARVVSHRFNREIGEVTPAPPSQHPVVEIMVRAATLEDYLAGSTEAARDVFPGTPYEAAIKLWLVDLDEDLDTGRDPFAVLRRMTTDGPRDRTEA